MPIGYSSEVVNGQLVPVAPEQSFDPLTFGQAYTGPGRWPRQGVYNVPPVLPSAANRSVMAPVEYGSAAAVPVPTATDHKGNPYHPTKSPLWWALGFLVVGFAMLHYIHYR